MMQRYATGLTAISMIIAGSLAGCEAASSSPESGPSPTPAPPTPTAEVETLEWILVWQDEFEGEELDLSKWTFDIGGSGWGNNEWQFYTDRAENVRLEDGVLIIEAQQEEFRSANYTSARIKTQGLHAWTYGRIEARIKMPEGQGIWPAFWMLGEDISTLGWPDNGEIDIMEYLGHETSTVHGTVHGPGYAGADGIGRPYQLTGDTDFTNDFHVFGIEWVPGQIQWYVDDDLFQTLTYADVPGKWVYDHPFFIILNLAVGGNWPGYPDETTQFPQQLRVDYVRVYQKDEYENALDIVPTIAPIYMTLAALDITAESGDDGWLASAVVTILDEVGEPVEGVLVHGKWIGYDRETVLTTDANGMAGPFISETRTESGTLAFCVTGVEKEGYFYDTMSSIDTCTSITNQGR